MNNKMLLSGLLCSAVVAGSFTYMYQANAQSLEQSEDLVSESQMEKTATVASKDAPFKVVGSSAIKNNLPLNLAVSNELSKFSKSENKNPIVELYGHSTQDWGTDISQMVNYRLESGSIISIHQTEYAPETSVDDAVDYFMNIDVYDPEHLSTRELNGFKAVISDEPQRKIVYVMGSDFVYTISTVYRDVDIDYLLDIGMLIKE